MAVLISEYMIHGDLKDYIEQARPNWDMRLQLIRDSTDGLAYLHGQKPPIRHGDLKAGNVLINGELRAMLADFGLSKVIEEGATGLTTSDGLKGTLRYYSPELMSESKANHGLSSDIWAWACLALEVRIMGSALAMLPRTEPEGLQALTDEIPYATKNTEQSIIIALMRGELPSDAESLRIHAPDLKDLFAKCWTIQPNERPSAAECLRILNSVLSTSRANTPAERADALESLIQSYFEHDLAFLSRPSSPFPAAADSEWMINSLGGEYIYLAIALYAYTASPDYPREISFSKGDILEIGDISNKWWPARTNDGTIGIAPSNYLQIL